MRTVWGCNIQVPTVGLDAVCCLGNGTGGDDRPGEPEPPAGWWPVHRRGCPHLPAPHREPDGHGVLQATSQVTAAASAGLSNVTLLTSKAVAKNEKEKLTNKKAGA